MTSISVKYWISIVDEFYKMLRGPLQLLDMTHDAEQAKMKMIKLNNFLK